MRLLRPIWLFVRLSRPVFLVGGALLYALGAAIAYYLGKPIDPGRYLLGQGLVLCIQLMAQYLNEYFDAAGDSANPNRTPLSGGSGVLSPEGLDPRVALYAAVAVLAVAVSLTTALHIRVNISPSVWLILVLGFIGAFAYSAPPLRLVSSGYGEVMISVLVAALVPSFGYALQTGGLHILIALASFPLIALHMAMVIALQLPDYTADRQSDKRTLAVRLGWRVAMRIHNGAIVVAAISMVIGVLVGLPMRIALSMAIAMPLAGAQIWQMWRIRRGFAPLWRTITLGAVALFALVVYFELIGFLLT
jgi:1,4-dihydroxy-2-naphthoate octaprenyltransferase